MKKLLLFLCAVLLFSSCATTYTTVGLVDFKEYNEEGFFISAVSLPDAVKYTPIGFVTIRYRQSDRDKNSGTISKPVYYDNCKEAVDILVKSAKEMGANAVIDFKLGRFTVDSVDTYTCSGYAVSIENSGEK